MGISFSHKGDFLKTEKYFQRLLEVIKLSQLDKYGRAGVDALASATPKDTGKTASSWQYRINRSGERVSVEWYNTNYNDGVNIAVVLQYGHATGLGAYVEGRDYINPALRPIFDDIAIELWKEVVRV